MDKISTVILVLKMLLKFLKDSDNDGRPDIFDSEPENPEVK
jgi:hypothetical protein